MSKNKKKISANSINKGLAITCALMGVVIVVLTVALCMKLYESEQLDQSDIFSKAQDACNQYEYAELVIARQENIDNQTYTAEYVTTDERDGSYCTYMFRDSEDNDLYQCWQEISKNAYDIYIHSKDLDAWVKTFMEEPPVYTNLWTMFTNAGGYTVMDSEYPWYDTGDMCYVLQRTGVAEGWSDCYEEVYIRKSDFLPMGLVLIVGNSTTDIDHTDVESGVNVDGEDVDIETSTFGYDNIVQKYSLQWSHDDLRLFDIPDKFITDEDYLSIVGQSEENNGED